LAVFDEYWLIDAQTSLVNRCARPCRRKLALFPDVASTHSDTYGQLGFGAEGKICIGLFGQLDWRKGLIEFLRAARLAQLINPELVFLLAGKLHIDNFDEKTQFEILEFLDEPPTNLRCVLDGISSEAEFNALLKQSDVIHLAYKNFAGSSNILSKAAHCRIPVIASPGNLIGRRVRDYSLGWTVAAETEQAYLDVVLGLSRKRLDQAQVAGRWDAYLALHNLARMRSMFAQLIAGET
jgi:glycosyltransferase involved in cell wall biosynthesis